MLSLLSYTRSINVVKKVVMYKVAKLVYNSHHFIAKFINQNTPLSRFERGAKNYA